MDSPIPTTTGTTSLEEMEDWELCNDDGFVYKRRKRHDDISRETSKPPDPELDPVVEERNRRLRKKRLLLKLKRKYQREIDQWEILSNTLNAIQEKSDRVEDTRDPNETSSFPEEDDSSRPSSMVDELLVMVEAQEAIIEDITNLCQVSENICRIEEEEKRQSFFDLDIWSSPTDLMASLCASD